MPAFLVAVFVLTFSLQLSAIFLLPESLLQAGLIGLGAIAPGVLALFLGVPRGKGGRPGLAALGAVVIPISVGLIASLAGGGGVALRPQTPDPTTIYLLLFAPVFEELAWRGLLQRRWDDALRARTGRPASYTVPRVSLAVGLVWGLWHLPMALDGTALAFVIFVAHTAIVAVWIGALYELAGRRVWVPMLAHAAINLRLFDVPDGTTARLVGTTATLGFAWLATRALAQRAD